MDKNNYHIIVIDQEPGDFRMIEKYLQEFIEAPSIRHLQSFADAEILVAQENINCDIILVTLSLPDKNGEKIITDLAALGNYCPIIILTGYADMEFSILSLSMGAADYLLKDEISAASLYKSIIFSIERKKATDALKKSEKKYSNLFHLSPQPNWIFDIDTLKFMQVNKAAVTLYGYTEEEFLNMTIMQIRPPAERRVLEETIRDLRLTEHRIYFGTSTHSKKSGECLEVEIYATPILVDDKICRSVIAIDVTEKNLLENKITKAIIQTQEEERYEIGGELHDNVCQILAAAQMSLGMMQRSLPPMEIKWYDQSRSHILMAADEIRNISHRLAPVFFDDSTLEDSFRILLKTFNTADKYQVKFFFDPSLKKNKLTQDLKLNLYRILQEQLRNIFKYAEAATIEVDLAVYSNSLKMRISDDGVGFDINTVKKGIGIANMKRRAELFSGSLDINSSPGNGCEILVEIPLQRSSD